MSWDLSCTWLPFSPLSGTFFASMGCLEPRLWVLSTVFPGSGISRELVLCLAALCVLRAQLSGLQYDFNKWILR